MRSEPVFPDSEPRLLASCRVAWTALLPALGQFAEQAVDSVTSALAQIKAVVPFDVQTVGSTQPETDLDWIMATANAVASGFECSDFKPGSPPSKPTISQNHSGTTRLSTLFEQIRLEDSLEPAIASRKCYRLESMTPAGLFPVAAVGYELKDRVAARQEYARLWADFETALAQIPASHRDALPLWLDHFETLWACYAATIPTVDADPLKSDVSLYDHSKAVAALAVALWRYYHDQGRDPETVPRTLVDRADGHQLKFLLIQGDCFGIQDFIFATGGATQKRAAKLLRGRSFYVSLLSECAALRILDALDLPGISQITNAAGKLLIIAPNTPETVEKLTEVQHALDDWFLTHTWGQSGIGLAWEPACVQDFLKSSGENQPFKALIKRLFEQLEAVKLRRLNLCGSHAPAPLFTGYLEQFEAHGECQIDGHSPATHQVANVWVCNLAADQIAIGQHLTHRDRILITRTPLRGKTLITPIFGYSVSFTDDLGETGWFSPEARNGNLRRCWDISMPETMEQPLWNGCARRAINGYIPRFEADNAWESDKYDFVQDDADFDPHPGEPKTLNHLACEDRCLNEQGHWDGVAGLMTLKGDVDNLGAIFQRGLSEPTFGLFGSSRGRIVK